MRYGPAASQRQTATQMPNPCYACEMFSQNLQRAISTMLVVHFRDQQREIENLLNIKIAEMRQDVTPLTPQSPDQEPDSIQHGTASSV